VKVNTKKILLVVFITTLIWVWADLAQNDELQNVPARVEVDESANPRLWVSLEGKASVPIKMTLSGPGSKITEIERKLKLKEPAAPLPFRFIFDAVAEAFDTPGAPAYLDLLAFLQRNKDLRKLGVSVESVVPSRIAVQVLKLTEADLKVECVDEQGGPLLCESIQPNKISMLVPQTWQGEKLKAFVEIPQAQIAAAARTAVRVTPYIKLPGDRRKMADVDVNVKMHPVEPRLQERQISATVGIVCSENTLRQRYAIEWVETAPSVIKIKATPEALQAYEDGSFELKLIIEDADTENKDTIVKQLVYNFPTQFVAKNEIQQVQDPPTVKFRLIPVPAEAP